MVAHHYFPNFREPVIGWLLLLVGIFYATIALLLVVFWANEARVSRFDSRIEHQRNRRAIGGIIQKEVLLIGHHAHHLAKAADIYEVEVLRRKIGEETDVIENALLVLAKGGVLEEKLPTNIVGVGEIHKRIVYPQGNADRIVVEVVELTPMVRDLSSGTDELARLVQKCFSATTKEERASLDRAVSFRLKRVCATTHRACEQANRIYYDTARRLAVLEVRRDKSNARMHVAGYVAIVASASFVALVGGLILVRVSRNLAERDKATKELCRSKRATQEILQKLPLGVIVVGQDRILQYANDTAIEMAGYSSADELVGRICPMCSSQAEGCPILQLGRLSDNSERTMIAKNGEKIPILKTVIPFTVDGKPVLLEAFIDITERKDSEKALRDHAKALEESRHAAEESSRSKSEFLANMSHEFRTPLHGILSFAAFGRKRVETDDHQKLLDYFEKIDRGAKTLLHLVNDLLDLSKLEAEKTALDIIELDLYLLIGQIIDEFSSTVARQSISIVCEKPHFDTKILADQTRMEQVARNLMSNAVKFSPEGSTIEVQMKRNGDTVTVSVLDRGIGIPEGELESVFDKFIQSSITRTGAGGTGLGLAICREIIESHKGRIWAENRSDGGAVLRFEIPVKINEADPGSSPEREKECASGRG